jgi:hypothetical protein
MIHIYIYEGRIDNGYSAPIDTLFWTDCDLDIDQMEELARTNFTRFSIDFSDFSKLMEEKGYRVGIIYDEPSYIWSGKSGGSMSKKACYSYEGREIDRSKFGIIHGPCGNY